MNRVPLLCTAQLLFSLGVQSNSSWNGSLCIQIEYTKMTDNMLLLKKILEQAV